MSRELRIFLKVCEGMGGAAGRIRGQGWASVCVFGGGGESVALHRLLECQ